MINKNHRLNKEWANDTTTTEGVPEGWVETSLSSVIKKLESGSRPRGGVRGIADGIPSLGAKHLSSDGSFNFDSIKYVPRIFFDRMNQGHIQKNDILVVKDGATTAKVSFISNSFPFDTAVVNEHVFICRPLEGVYPPFLFYYLFSDEGQNRILENFRGSAQGGINQSFATRTNVPMAPAKEQQRIVSKLEHLLPRIKDTKGRLETVIQILKVFRQAVLAAAFSGKLTEDWRSDSKEIESVTELIELIAHKRRHEWQARKRSSLKYINPVDLDRSDLLEIPHNWMWISADAICSQITDGEHIQPPYQSTGYPMLSAKHVRDGYIIFEDVGFINEDDFLNCLKRCAPVPNDILIVSVGATTGRSAIVVDSQPFAIVRSVLLLRPLIDSRYFLYWTHSSWCNEWMKQASGASAQPHLYIRDVGRMPVPLPPSEEQQEIVRRVEILLDLAKDIENKVASTNVTIDKLTKSILFRAYHGELVATEAELAQQEARSFETAEALLDRISLEYKITEKLVGKPMSKQKSPRKVQTHIPLFKVLNDNEAPMTPELLFRKAGFEPSQIDLFYRELLLIRDKLDEIKPEMSASMSWPYNAHFLLKLKREDK